MGLNRPGRSGGPRLTLTLTLGCWVFGSVGSGWAFTCSTYVYIYRGSFVGRSEGSFRGVRSGGFISRKRRFYYTVSILFALATGVIFGVFDAVPR